MRIVSLLPSATEVVAALGLAKDLVGISHECDYPPEVKDRPVLVKPTVEAERVTSADIDRQVRARLAAKEPLYRLDEALFRDLRPDLVISQDLCHVCAVTPDQLQRLVSSLQPVPRMLTLNPTTLAQVLGDIERIGTAVGRQNAAKILVGELRTKLDRIGSKVAGVAQRPKVLCLEWLSPFFLGGHWVPEMVDLAGGLDPLGTAKAPSRQVTWEEIVAAAPDVLVFMPCGFTIDRTLHELGRLDHHPDWSCLPAVRTGRVFAVEAVDYFSRPGPRLIDGVTILAALCHPSRFRKTVPPGARQVPAMRLGRRADTR
ncbi:MAG: cobalamin-binding protein [Nitrospirales bacterium]